ncbi:hypothetical protein phiAS5_ORF0232 [Aeromonas phage phiAS5]|uniref:Uncharacterized protein n=1 Tax=Aeromonas phage phiAS5 TaxID=879630 RepID=E1A1Y6_9CAUD|nr:hypothetical protein phiAS5_ORF0232 [Aeromonas phage phiAS5]ADM80075.1 hypothetical protein phiAS5_ORF0232 [Aeromonas phage phiAS5]BES53159.1 hypothetical protein [Aeromonas phage phiWae14]
MVKESYRGYVRVTTERSKHFGRVVKMTSWDWRDGIRSARLDIDGKTTYLSLNSLEAVSDEVAKKEAGSMKTKIDTIVQIVTTDGKENFMSPATNAAAMEAARKHKIENPTDRVSIWRLSGHISNPRVITDFISA